MLFHHGYNCRAYLDAGGLAQAGHCELLAHGDPTLLTKPAQRGGQRRVRVSGQENLSRKPIPDSFPTLLASAFPGMYLATSLARHHSH